MDRQLPRRAQAAAAQFLECMPMTHPEFVCTVVTSYLADQSDPAQDQYAFAYTVTVRNTGDVTAQLVARHWIVTDAAGHVEEVRGLAVVGHQPVLKPGEQFEYTSWTRLATPRGRMRGTFFCMTDDARAFETPVHEFELTRAQALH
jgi:ApaG protein